MGECETLEDSRRWKLGIPVQLYPAWRTLTNQFNSVTLVS